MLFFLRRFRAAPTAQPRGAPLPTREDLPHKREQHGGEGAAERPHPAPPLTTATEGSFLIRSGIWIWHVLGEMRRDLSDEHPARSVHPPFLGTARRDRLSVLREKKKKVLVRIPMNSYGFEAN